MTSPEYRPIVAKRAWHRRAATIHIFGEPPIRMRRNTALAAASLITEVLDGSERAESTARNLFGLADQNVIVQRVGFGNIRLYRAMAYATSLTFADDPEARRFVTAVEAAFAHPWRLR